ncbi:MAG: hypothetical protein HYT87_11040 [Nitrospirae bacterium]|nr:hypothetical protein [Nitrospirota bacterium]
MAFPPGRAEAVTADFSGYFRSRGFFFRDRDIDNDRGPNTTAFIDQRLKLDTEFALSDEVKAAVQLDVLDNLVWGINGPALVDLPDLARADQADREAGVSDALSVRRAWGEMVTPLGVLVAGRQPVHWGLGVFYNDGNCLNCDFGDTQDRVFFSTRVGPVVVSPYYGKVIEGRVETRAASGVLPQEFLDDGKVSFRDAVSMDADASDLGVAVRYQPKGYEAGFLMNGRFQRVSPFKGRLVIMDGYGKADLAFLRAEGELVFINGRASNAALPTPQRTRVTQLGLFGSAYWNRPYLHFGGQYGLATGPGKDEYDPFDPERWLGRQQNEFKFDPDFNVDLLLFEEVVNRREVRENFRSIGGGRVRNAHLAKLFWFGDWSFARPRASIEAGFAADPVGGKRYLGVEADMECTFRLQGGFETLAQVGMLIPGTAAQAILESQRKSPAFAVRLGGFFRF